VLIWRQAPIRRIRGLRGEQARAASSLTLQLPFLFSVLVHVL
jgi:hypothetical protein